MDPRYQPPSAIVRGQPLPSTSPLKALLWGVMAYSGANFLLRAVFWTQLLVYGIDTKSFAWRMLAAVPGTVEFVLMTLAGSAVAGLGGYVAARRGGNMQVFIVLGLVIAVGGYFLVSSRYPHWSQAVGAALTFASVQIGAYIGRRRRPPG
jgi:hypothetical protein